MGDLTLGCKGCKHYQPHGFLIFWRHRYARCGHRMSWMDQDRKYEDRSYCSTMRSNYGSCKPEARLYEPKDRR